MKTMSPSMFQRFGKRGENWESMDEEIRKEFKIPSNRYYSVTLPPSPPGRIFVDKTRTRVLRYQKISKSSQ